LRDSAFAAVADGDAVDARVGRALCRSAPASSIAGDGGVDGKSSSSSPTSGRKPPQDARKRNAKIRTTCFNELRRG
jgi:hypothetical protein